MALDEARKLSRFVRSEREPGASADARNHPGAVVGSTLSAAEQPPRDQLTGYRALALLESVSGVGDHVVDAAAIRDASHWPAALQTLDARWAGGPGACRSARQLQRDADAWSSAEHPTRTAVVCA